MSKTIRKDKKKRKMKKRFIFLNIVAMVMILFFVKYIDIVGDHYDVHSTLYADESALGRISVSFEPEGIVKASDAFLSDDGEVLIPTASERTGETDMTIGIQRDEEGTDRIIKTHLRVSVMGTIIEKNDRFTNFNGYQLVCYLFLAFMLSVMCVMIFSFFECQKKSDFSYPMVAYGGVAIFLAVLLVIVTYKILNNVVNTFSALIALIMQTGEWFIVLLSPFLLVMAIALSVSNIWLMRHEGFRPANALGIVISVLWLIGVVFSLNIGIFGYTLFDSEIWYQIRYILTFIVTYFECMLMSTSVCAFLASRYTPPMDRDYIIILGCAIRSDGSLTPLLRGRADAALSFEKRQFEETGKHACFVPSGGQGADEVISEGEAMERYLIDQGVEPERICREDKSVNTFENMQFSKAVIEENIQAPADINSVKIAFATTNYHIFRGYILAAKNGYTAKGISAKTKWYFFPNAFIREFIGLLADQIWRHFVIIGLMILILLGIALML
ncbi:MAG: YdcF family protein [Ruminococcus sp.]|uniref:YdcF family protein n=1 Tax=Ruminococcus sp. TaxID=41978 RepID=UPI002872B16F|nr:YdcF family protein [Ruminococcus sp.]MBQ3284798.1 YdcF family protein [Ruminococcus sp.]